MDHSHCRLRRDPICFEVDQTQVFYDEANRYLITFHNGIFKILSVDDPGIPPQTIDFVRHGAVLGVSLSLDKKHLCVQRSSADVDIICLQDASEMSYSCMAKSQGCMVVGFVWVNTGLCDIALITTGGLELLRITSKDVVQLVKHDRRAIHWYRYYHETRLVMVCTGKEANTIQCFQFLPDKLMRMPDFDPDVALNANGKRSRLERNDFILCKIYEKLCCVYVFAKRQEMIVYQLGKDAIGRLCTINLYSACDNYALSIVDNLLIVHNLDSKITLIFDIWLMQWSDHPVAAPLPLGAPVSAHNEDRHENLPSELSHADSYLQEWNFEQPNIILDKKAGKLWFLEISLQNLCIISSDKVNLVRCLLKRRDGISETLSVIRNAVRDREPLFSLYQMFSVVVEASVSLSSASSNVKMSKWWYYQPDRHDPAVKNAEEKTANGDQNAHLIFPVQIIHQESVVDSSYLMAVVTEYLRSLSARGIMAETFLVDFQLELITSSDPPRFAVLHQLLQYHVIQDSLPVARRLLSLISRYPPAFQLGLDMLHRLRLPQEVARVLLEYGKLTEALRYINTRASDVHVPAAEILEAARATGDNQKFYLAFRFVQVREEGGGTSEAEKQPQAMHADQYEQKRRNSPGFLPSDSCEEHVEFYKKMFESV
ncbi:hypothetical protein GUITHDRAFT_106875 [Guillardia theta CCMP2712]|uniref:Uncharacterized protein n=1 Tax=Guillardia theta (strain CCMP2712) TaxID=905079 RepID=L1JGJ2_GUITC|nr:hypothetical protein GUITHDRAFT_106875 [Guillardia theta CCMP2712]EKX47432.1 hypothetical protein GUITHDRAFT_106875 [Guillardia theta CCMP2712]|eukprot:XP_005834412.1 hypothetical protein GUITHDRAFT_106875 [Guillardia theta CCMP2712]